MPVSRHAVVETVSLPLFVAQPQLTASILSFCVSHWKGVSAKQTFTRKVMKQMFLHLSRVLEFQSGQNKNGTFLLNLICACG